MISNFIDIIATVIVSLVTQCLIVHKNIPTGERFDTFVIHCTQKKKKKKTNERKF